MGGETRCRVFRDGTASDVPYDGAAIRDALSQGATVWIDVLERPGEADPSFERLLAEALVDQVDLGQFEPRRLSNVGRPPKVKVFDDTAFVRAYVTDLKGEGTTRLRAGEVHILAGHRFLVTVRYAESGKPAPELPREIDQRWGRAASRLATEGGHLLLYMLLQEIVDDYLGVVEVLDQMADDVESRVLEQDPVANTGRATAAHHRELQRDIVNLKHDLGEFRRVILPYGEVRELVREQAREDVPPLSDFREVSEGVLRVVELVDNVRDILTASFEAEQTQVSIELNENMKKVTSWAAILLVPTLIAGIYGMNFQHMPELGWGFGYPGALATMLGSAAILYLRVQAARLALAVCRALKVLCVAADQALLRELRHAAVGATWELAPGALTEDDALAQLTDRRAHVMVVFGGLRGAAGSCAGGLSGSPDRRGPRRPWRSTRSSRRSRRFDPAIAGLPRPGGPVGP